QTTIQQITLRHFAGHWHGPMNCNRLQKGCHAIFLLGKRSVTFPGTSRPHRPSQALNRPSLSNTGTLLGFRRPPIEHDFVTSGPAPGHGLVRLYSYRLCGYPQLSRLPGLGGLAGCPRWGVRQEKFPEFLAKSTGISAALSRV